ncbi:UNVERIFIED_CONTAM: hypothetical protein FKN15_051483 [Acipenser sinensis]
MQRLEFGTTLPDSEVLFSQCNWEEEGTNRQPRKLKKETGEALQCPAKSTKAPIGSSYKSLAGHLNQFQELGYIPMDIDTERLNGIEATMMTHLASWHKTCCLKCNQTKLERLQSKSREEQKAGTSSAVHTSSSHGNIVLTGPICFLCDKPAGSAGFHLASTYDIGSRVRRCAMELQDIALLAKLAPGNMIALEAKYHLKCLV